MSKWSTMRDILCYEDNVDLSQTHLR